MTVLLTVLSGTLIYVIGQLVSKFVLDPMYDLRKAVGEVRFNLSFHGAVIHTPAAREEKISDKARDALLKDSSDLLSILHAVPLYDTLRFLSPRLFPSRRSIERAAVQLRGLSTYVYDQDATLSDLEAIASRVNNIETLLNLESLERE